MKFQIASRKRKNPHYWGRTQEYSFFFSQGERWKPGRGGAIEFYYKERTFSHYKRGERALLEGGIEEWGGVSEALE